ncbi:hypothetical protein BDA96_01G299100 [Sorghum bicolor]|uniref:Uncharacterized protein n=1 Tax=Sorghum bicolor TaxID=4558 RepID=A0A921S247_SORBI|nr:hypothetical protein BDA96_01G299100 [Sorghum bicolor]KAG0549965.1 hypothetical protein BDA96_01G299100 [Sorghum bicolor]
MHTPEKENLLHLLPILYHGRPFFPLQNPLNSLHQRAAAICFTAAPFILKRKHVDCVVVILFYIELMGYNQGIIFTVLGECLLPTSKSKINPSPTLDLAATSPSSS